MSKETGFSQEDLAAITRSAHFAAERHCGHVRWSARKIAYINHPIEVAMLVAAHGGDAVAVQAGYVHDTVEDTGATIQEIDEELGGEVAGIVDELSDDPSLSDLEQKKAQVASMPSKSWRARLVKIADQTSNVRYVVDAPPPHWDIAKRKGYALKCKAVVDAGRGTSASLEAEFDAVFARVAKAYGIEEGESWSPLP